MFTIATPVPYLRRNDRFGGGDLSGSMSVHEDLLIWSLTANVAQEVWILPEKLGLLAGETSSNIALALTELPVAIASRVQQRSATWLVREGVWQSENLIATGKAMDFAALAHLRTYSSRPFAICCIVHAVLFPDITSSLLSALIHAQKFDRFIATSCAAVDAMSVLLVQTKEKLLSAFPMLHEEDVHLPNVTLVPLGVDDEYAVADRQDAREQLGIPQDAIVLLWVGRLTEHYKADLDPLLRTFHILRNTFPKLYLVLAGNTVQAQRYGLKGQVAETEQQIKIINNFPRSYKPVIYGCADIFVSPVDNVQESFGLSLLEAMVSGLPVVASDWSGYRDIVIDGVTGYLIRTFINGSAWKDADVLESFAVAPAPEYHIARYTAFDVSQFMHSLRYLIEAPEHRRELGRAGQHRVRTKFLWSKVIKEYRTVWREQVKAATESQYRRIPGLRLREAFTPYCSQSVDFSGNLIIAHQSDINEYCRKFPGDFTGANILNLCLNRPTPFNYFSNFADPQVQRIAFWLLKKGFLRTVIHAPTLHNQVLTTFTRATSSAGNGL